MYAKNRTQHMSLIILKLILQHHVYYVNLTVALSNNLNKMLKLRKKKEIHE